MKQDWVIGIDGGGTSTRAVLAHADGRVLGQGRAGTSNYDHAGEAAAQAAITSAIDAAFAATEQKRQPVAALHLGLAGIVNAKDHAAARRLGQAQEITPPERIGTSHDIRIALTGGLRGEPGIALIAGTGSSCYGRSGNGEEHQCGGWGALADDVGSASWLGHQAIRQAARQADGRDPETALRKVVFDFLDITEVFDLMHRLHVIGLERDEMAQLCPLVIQLAEAEDATAVQLLNTGAQALAELVGVTANRLKLESPQVVLAGGLATSGAPYQPKVEAAITTTCSTAVVRPAFLPPEGGAVLEAYRLSGIPLTSPQLDQLHHDLTTD